MLYPVEKITVPADRQRKSFTERDLNALRESISRRGIISPITIHSDGSLIAGERRLRCAIELKLSHIPVHIFENLSHEDQEAIQLEENIRRADITWQEEAQACAKIHGILRKKNKDQTQSQTADYLGMAPTELSRQISIATYLAKDPEKIAHCVTGTAAYNIIQRLRDRAIERETVKVQNGVVPSLDRLFTHDDEPETTVAETVRPAQPVIKPVEASIIKGDFCEWSAVYTGPKFNFIHCDFPYGVNIHKSEQMSADSWGAYKDTPETFWKLTTALFENAGRIMSPSAHIFFWFSMDYYRELLNFLEQFSELTINPFPLIWSKSDGSGVLPDPKRGPRRTYETALLISRGDRQIVKPVNNSYSAPIGSKVHLSEKPQPVLRYFFGMLLDETSTMLDPTCGSGNALAVAEEFKVKSTFGLDIDDKCIELSQAALRKARLYKRMGDVNIQST